MEIAELKWKQGNAEIERDNYSTINYLVECSYRKYKKAVITKYCDASPAMVPKIGDHQYCNNNVATPGLPTLLLSTQ